MVVGTHILTQKQEAEKGVGQVIVYPSPTYIMLFNHKCYEFTKVTEKNPRCKSRLNLFEDFSGSHLCLTIISIKYL